MLLVDLNSTTSVLQNGMFEICGSLAFGDCGYLAILNSIRSNPEISKQILLYILEKLRKDYNRRMKKEFNVDLLRKIIAEERYNQKIQDMLSDEMKTLLTYDFDDIDHPLLNENDSCYDEDLKKAYDQFKENKSSTKKKKTFLDLLTRSAESSKTKFEHVYFLSQADILFLPMSTDYMVGALCIKQDEDTTIAVKTDVVSDFGYNDYMKGYILRDCQYFIILRQLGGHGGHFDYFLGTRTQNGLFKRDSVEAEYILSLCNEKDRYMLTGAGEIPETKKKSLTDWVEEMKAEDTSQMVYECRFPTEVIEWFELAYNFPSNYRPERISTSTVFDMKEYMVDLELDFIPIYVETHNFHKYLDEIKYHVDSLVVLFHDKDTDSLILLDCNLMYIPNIFRRDNFKQHQISSLAELLLSKQWKIPEKDDIRNIEIEFLYEWDKRYEGGIFYRKIYKDLNCDADIFDRDRVANACRRYIKLIKSNKEKRKYFKLYLIFRNKHLKRYFDCYKNHGESLHTCYDKEEMNELNMLFRQIYPEYHQIIDASEDPQTTTDSPQHFSLLRLDLEMLAHNILSKSPAGKIDSYTKAKIQGNLSLFDQKVYFHVKNDTEGEFGVDPIISDFDDAIELLIFQPEKSPLNISKFIWMKLLGMVYSEEVFMLGCKSISMNEKSVNFWLMFATCIKRCLGEEELGECNVTKATEKTNQMKTDKKWFDDQSMGEFRSYWNTKQHTKYLYYYHEVKNAINFKVKSEKESVLPVNGSFDLQYQLTTHMKDVIKKYRYYHQNQNVKNKQTIADSTISRFDNFIITCGDVYNRLFGQQWLNDNIIDAFSAVLQKQSKNKIILSSFLLNKDLNKRAIIETKDWICRAIGSVQKHPSNYDGKLHEALENVHSLMIPACFNSHWYLCVVHLKNNVATVIDGYNSEDKKLTNNLLLRVLLTLQYYHKNTAPIPNFKLKTMTINKTFIPEQQDSSNCGVIVLKTLYGLMKPTSIIYSSDTSESIKFREYVFFEIMKASGKEYKITIDTTQYGDMNYWDNVNVFDDISTQIKTQQKSEKIGEKTRKKIRIEQILYQIFHQQSTRLRIKI